MRLPQLLLPIILLSLIRHTVAVSNTNLAKPGCPSTCLGITIPYPFGVQANCYLNKAYYVACSTDSGKPRLRHVNTDLVEISLDGSLRVASLVARACYNETSQVIADYPQMRLQRFPISLAKNKITTIGCDARGYINANDSFEAGCSTLPGKCNRIIGECSNVSCCQSTVEPAQLINFHFYVRGNMENVGKKGFYNCSYAFILEDGSYDLSKISLDDIQNYNSFNMVLDWTVGDTNCEEAQKDKNTYRCQERSECHDVQNGRGYRCSCNHGYEGNPYLQDGCQDINECDDPRLHNCTHVCINTFGDYACSCPKGYHGDGRKDGTSCIPKQTNLRNLGIYVGVSLSAIVTSLTMVFIYCLVKQRRVVKCRERCFEQNGGMIFRQLLSECVNSAQVVKIYSENELKKATNNFDQKNILGQGGHGTVYRGMLPDTTVVAIKKSKAIDLGQIEQFVNEVVLVSQINHPHVVKLLGCCLETPVPLLVYEFVANETLFHHLHEKQFESMMTWRMRLTIAAETAEALAYMHSETQIIHRDIKSSNILLNYDYNAKVSDFGISRFLPMDRTHLSTQVQGTLGYIDPDYFYTGVLTEKSDVYSFGVVLVELITGARVHSFDRPESRASLADYFLSAMEHNQLKSILDDQMRNDGFPEQLNLVAEVAKKCLNLEGKNRPTMKEVAEELKAVSEKLYNFSDLKS